MTNNEILHHLKTDDYSQVDLRADLWSEECMKDARSQVNHTCASCDNLDYEMDIDTVVPICRHTGEECPEHEKDCCLVTNGREPLTVIEYEVYEIIILCFRDEWRMPTQKELAHEFGKTQGWAWGVLHQLREKGYIRIHEKSRGIELTDYRVRLERYDGVVA